MLAILNLARDNLSEEDYEMFLWEDPELALKLVTNYVRFGDSVT